MVNAAREWGGWLDRNGFDVTVRSHADGGLEAERVASSHVDWPWRER